MRRCHRCYYIVGLTETRCRLCGAKVPRVRAAFIATISLAVGLALGWVTITVL